MSDQPFIRNDGTGQRAILASIAAKQAQRPRVDANGNPLDPPTAFEYDTYGQMVGKAKPATDPPAA